MNTLAAILEQHKHGQTLGLASICSAHPFVLECAMRHAARSGGALLVEATCNQVNQYGGYSGKRPAGFAAWLGEMAQNRGLAPEALILGGDHLGPSPWQTLPAEEAMRRAETLVSEFAAAGFGKLHLDASMRLGGDDPQKPLALETVVARTLRLARAVEAAGRGGNNPVYVIGSEVPIPGGAKAHEDGVAVSDPADVAQTITQTRRAFEKNGLASAWERVAAVVVQPGVEFGDDFVLDFDPAGAQALSAFIETQPGLVYEAHSTDYQSVPSLRALVANHFAILKVGPALTYAYRQALFSLAMLEEECLPAEEQSHLIETIEAAMLAEPGQWRQYYGGDSRSQALARKYSFSDRMRYYWAYPEVQGALGRLLGNLRRRPMPLTLLSQFAPPQYEKIRAEALANEPLAIVEDAILRVLEGYAAACGQGDERT